MDAATHFRRHSTRAWFAIAQITTAPYRFTAPDGSEQTGAQVLAATDLESGFILAAEPRAAPVGPIPAEEITAFCAAVIRRRGPPRVGFLFSISVWGSMDDLLADPETRPRFLPLRQSGRDWPPMAAAGRSTLESFCAVRRLRHAWTEEHGLHGLVWQPPPPEN